MTAPIPALTPHAIDSLRRWDEGPVVTGDEARYLVGVLRAALLALATRPPNPPPGHALHDDTESREWYDRYHDALMLAREVGSFDLQPPTPGGR